MCDSGDHIFNTINSFLFPPIWEWNHLFAKAAADGPSFLFER